MPTKTFYLMSWPAGAAYGETPVIQGPFEVEEDRDLELGESLLQHSKHCFCVMLDCVDGVLSGWTPSLQLREEMKVKAGQLPEDDGWVPPPRERKPTQMWSEPELNTRDSRILRSLVDVKKSERGDDE